MPVPIRHVRRFHAVRLALWTSQVPVAVLTPAKNSIAYLAFLSVAALVESALTDYLQSRQAMREDPTAEI